MKRVLFLTRKDSKHPHAGGAEKVMHEYAKGLVALGHQVTWFAYTFPGAKEKDSYDGIEIIRKFTLKSSYFLFPFFYKKHLKGKYDVVIDEAGGLPLLSPLYEKKTPIVFFAHHIGDRERDFNYPRPVSTIGKRLYFQLFKVYKNTPTIAVSQSTKDELVERFGFLEKKVTVIENACDITPIKKIDRDKKEDEILFLGRLMPIKRVEDAIKAFHHFISSDSQFSHYVLNIVGNDQDKKYVKKLKDLVSKLGIENNVNFCGYIPRESFDDFISSHKAMLVTSIKEGFGLVVLEGNSYGLPVIGYDVAGLRDSIKDGVNGFLVKDGDYEKVGSTLRLLVSNHTSLQKSSQTALNYVKTLPHREEQTKKVEDILLGNCD